MKAAAKPNVLGGSTDADRGSWCTPKWLAEMIGPFDLDPCSNPRSHIVAGRRVMLEGGDDGLVPHQGGVKLRVADWSRVFINPPYANGSVLRWFDAYKHTAWCFLLRFDPSTEWFAEVYDAASLIAVPKGRRVNFEPPPGVKASSNAIAHALYYRREQDATSAVLKQCVCWRKRAR